MERERPLAKEKGSLVEGTINEIGVLAATICLIISFCFATSIVLMTTTQPAVFVVWHEPTVVYVWSTHQSFVEFLPATILWTCTSDEAITIRFGNKVEFRSCEQAREAVNVMVNEFHWERPRPHNYGVLIHADDDTRDWAKPFMKATYGLSPKLEFNQACETKEANPTHQASVSDFAAEFKQTSENMAQEALGS